MSILGLWQSWKKYWFEPESPVSICVFRILFAFVLLWYCALLYPDLSNWFGPHGITSVQTSQRVLAPLGPPGINILAWMPAGDFGVNLLYWFLVVATLFLGLGLFARPSAACVFLALSALQQQNSLVMNGGDILVKMCAFYLVLAPCGYCLSVDSLLRSRHARDNGILLLDAVPSGWPQRLLRFQIALIYFQAFWSKLDDPTWIDGSALFYVLREQEFLRFPVAWISDNLWMCQTFTWGALCIEGAMWSLVWFKETRYIALTGALLLHLGIEYSMNLPTFESIMIASLIVFVPSEDLKKLAEKVRSLLLSRNGFLVARKNRNTVGL